MRNRFADTVLILVSVAAGFVFLEAGLRVLDLYAPPGEPLRAREPDLYEPHEAIGYRLHPSSTILHRTNTRPDPIPLRSNSDGFRHRREFGEADARTRILVLGDSFVFGWGVAEEERFTEQLETARPEWRVDNMGMTGWGIDLMVRALEFYGEKANPDVVLLSIYTDDFRRVLPYYNGPGYAIPKFELAGDQLVSVPYPFPTFWERFRLTQWLYEVRWKRNRNRFDLNRAILDRFLTQARALQATPVVIFIPGKADTPEDQQRRGFLRDWALQHGVAYQDLTEPIHGAGVDNVYIKNNWHWNAAGHAIAAREVEGLLRSALEVAVPVSDAELQ